MLVLALVLVAVRIRNDSGLYATSSVIQVFIQATDHDHSKYRLHRKLAEVLMSI